MKSSTDFISFLNRAVTPYHSVSVLQEKLREQGFTELSMGEEWDLCGLVRREGTAGFFTSPTEGLLFAFTVGSGYTAGSGFKLAAAHTDYPCLHVKPSGEINGSYALLDTEVYGGPILNTWLDRPLGLAGRAVINTADGISVKLFSSGSAIAVIPNLPIHFNREVNKGVELKKQLDLRPLTGGGALPLSPGWLKKTVAELISVSEGWDVPPEEILDIDAYLYNAAKAETAGLHGELLCSGRLDNQTSCYALLKGILAAKENENDGLAVTMWFDNEEIGNTTQKGADSALPSMLLEKIYDGLAMEPVRLREAIVNSRLLSLDVAHALHPNHPEKFDTENSGALGSGVILKMSANQRYSYDPLAIGEAIRLCGEYSIPYKRHVNHSDIAGGSTMGPVLSSRLPMPALDMGVPILAMHSASETMQLSDETALVEFTTHFLE